MDTSETYIKMCEKAEEIQNGWKPTVGDYIGGEWFVDDNDTIGLCFKGIIRELNPEGHSDCVSTGGCIFWAIESHIWLPRQDQLQEMLEEKNPRDLSLYFSNWITPFGVLSNGYCEQFTSMEQLWLAFVMKEKYNKVWTEEEWADEL